MQKTVAVIGLIVVLGAGIYFFTGKESLKPNPAPIIDEAVRPEGESPVETGEVAETGTDDKTAESVSSNLQRTTAVSYLTPARTTHNMDVALEIDETGVITGANILYDDGDGFSNPHQERFDGSYRQLVVGQNIDEFNLSTVAGASLTTKAFNEAVNKIAEDRV